MPDGKLGAVEARFADLVWENAPIASRELARLCEKELGWKRTTTYTQLKRLCDRGILAVKDSVVTSLISREAIQLSESRSFLKRTFSGSLADMVQAFTGGAAITKEEADRIRKLIDEYEEEK